MAEKSLSMNSCKGDAFQVSVAAGTEEKLSAVSLSMQSCIVWTPGTDVYLNLHGTADATKFLLPANVLFPIPVDDLEDVAVFNDDASPAIVYVLWRAR